MHVSPCALSLHLELHGRFTSRGATYRLMTSWNILQLRLFVFHVLPLPLPFASVSTPQSSERWTCAFSTADPSTLLQNLSEAERERRSMTRLYAEDQQAPFPPAPEQTAYAGPLLDQWVPSQERGVITVS